MEKKLNKIEAVQFLKNLGYNDADFLADFAFEFIKARTPKASEEQKEKMHTVMHEFKYRKLHSGTGKKGGHRPEPVENRKQAIAIGLSEAGLSRDK